jgi:C-terminal peptidase prc
MRLTLILLCMVFSPGFLAFGEASPRNEWEGTGLKPAHFEADVLSGCSADAVHFVGCVGALNYLGENFSAPLFLMPGTSLKALHKRTLKISSMPGNGMTVQNLDPKWSDQVRKNLSPGAITQKKLTELAASERVQVQEMIEVVKAHPEVLQFDFKPLFREWFDQALKGPSFKGTGEEAIVAQLYKSDFTVTDDPHKELMATRSVEEMMEKSAEEFSGVGLECFTLKSRVFVSRTYPKGPAELAGIKPGDEIVSVQGISAGKLDDLHLALKIRGAEGTDVEMVLRRGGQTWNQKVTRKKIQSDNVISTLIRRNGNTYGLIRIQSFMSQTTGVDASIALTSLKSEGATKIILDLRSNLGGSIEEAVNVASLFLNDRVIVKTEDVESHEEKELRGFFHYQDERIPLVVLVNFASASASEIVSGTLQEYGRAWIVGDRTFGKGLVQNLAYFHPERYGTNVILKRTTHVYRFPSGRTPHFYGVEPNFEVKEYPDGERIEPVTIREKEFYTGALPDESAWRLSGWTESRKEGVRSLKSCMKERGTARSQWKAWSDGGIGLMDYRLFVGLDLLDCVTP